MASLKFFTRSKTEVSQIYIRFIVGYRKEFQSKTGIVINMNDWSKEKSLPKPNSAENKTITLKLKNLETFILNEFNNDYSNGVDFTKKWIDDKINSFFNRKDDVINNEENEDDNYMLVYIKDHINFKKSITTTRKDKISKLNNLYDRFSQYQLLKKQNYLIKDVSGKVLIGFKDFLTSDCNFMDTTAARIIKDFKTVIFDAQNNGKEIHHQVKGFSTGSSNSEYKVFLSFQEIEKIKNIITLNKDWIHARDWLVIGCYLGQRFGDLIRMTKKMTYTKTDYEGDTYRFIEIKQQKTGHLVVIPIHEEVENVLKKYGGEFPPVFGETPDSNSTLFNAHIKKVCELAGIHEIVKGKVYNEDKKKYEIKNVEKCLIVSSHICRRSFATNFYGNKLFTTPQIMSITGHKSEAEFLNYIGKTTDDWAMQTAKTFKEISKKNIS